MLILGLHAFASKWSESTVITDDARAYTCLHSCVAVSFQLPVILYHGTKDQRAQLRRKISKRQHVVDEVYSQPVVVTSYEIVMNDRKFIQNFEWKYIIVDEGHRIKNFQCRLIRLDNFRHANDLMVSYFFHLSDLMMPRQIKLPSYNVCDTWDSTLHFSVVYSPKGCCLQNLCCQSVFIFPNMSIDNINCFI